MWTALHGIQTRLFRKNAAKPSAVHVYPFRTAPTSTDVICDFIVCTITFMNSFEYNFYHFHDSFTIRSYNIDAGSVEACE